MRDLREFIPISNVIIKVLPSMFKDLLKKDYETNMDGQAKIWKQDVIQLDRQRLFMYTPKDTQGLRFHNSIESRWDVSAGQGACRNSWQSAFVPATSKNKKTGLISSCLWHLPVYHSTHRINSK